MLLLLPALSPALSFQLPHAPSPAVRPAVAVSRTSSLVLMAKKKKGKGPKEASAALAALDAWEANEEAMVGAVDDGLAPVVAKKGKKPKKKKAEPVEAPAPAAASAATPGGPTLADKVARIKRELGLDEALPLGPAIKAANEAMGLEPEGVMAEQVTSLLQQLNIVDLEPTAAAPPAAAPPPPPPPPPTAACRRA